MARQNEATADTITVYSRAGCHLCELLVEALLPLVRGQLQVDVVDIESRPDWLQAYATRIPVNTPWMRRLFGAYCEIAQIADTWTHIRDRTYILRR